MGMSKIALLLAVGASAFIGISTEQSFAGCRQVPAGRQCDWLGRNCHTTYRTVCDNPAPASSLIKPGTTPQLSNSAKPGVNVNSGNSLISPRGGGLISQDGAGLKR